MDIIDKVIEFAITNTKLIAISSIVVIYLISKLERKNVPPGPTGLPIVGYIPFLRKFPHLHFIEMGKKYGHLIRLKLGPNKVVIVSDYKLAIEALNKDSLIGRPYPSIFSLAGEDHEGIAAWSGKIWKDHRRFLMKTLKSIGNEKQSHESLVADEVKFLLDYIDGQTGKPIWLEGRLKSAASNVVCQVVLGQRFDYDHPTRTMIAKVFGGDKKEEADGTETKSSEPGMQFTGYFCNFAWIIRLMLKMLSGYPNPVTTNFNNFHSFLTKVVDDHKDNDLSNPKDVIDAYLLELTKKDSSSLLSKSLLPGVISDMFGAGVGTVQGLVEWCLLCMALHPDVQKKMQEEIDANIGHERAPSYGDRANLPYTQAVISEALRCGTLLPLNLAREATEDTKLGGYTIPKGDHLFINFWALNRDPKLWKEPEKFGPENFLSEDGTTFLKKELIPFSYGKRSCPGEALGSIELFLFVSHIFQRFDVKPKSGSKLTTERKWTGFVLGPKERVELVFTRRH